MAVNAARGNAEEFDTGDVWSIFDGGLAGNKGFIINSFCNSENKYLSKTAKHIHIHYSESAMEARCTRLKEPGSQEGVALAQLETIHIVSRDAFQPSKKPRKHYSGCSTQGTILGPVGVPSPENAWLLTCADKTVMHGPMRAEVGNKVEDIEVADPARQKRRRLDSDCEPSTFHGMLTEVPSELIHSYTTAVAT
ncbi:unnamed protein product [Prorocentrum cordatum]|uniref:Uncharacterized protein n=1 Tax=Prorocentrum cordatum TaxID=2364126 RepID=A0ABN9TBS3_9DINO|nr:unnamed protein product [Polarella glacialis]